MLAIMMCALTGTLFIYQGQEIGMINIPKDWTIEDLKDIESLNFYQTMAASTNNDKGALDYVMRSIQILGRDNARLPMQWDSSPFAGFTDNRDGAWMRVHDLYPEINVEKQLKDPDSPYAFWKSMIRLRKDLRHVMVHGSFEMSEPENEQTFVFTKRGGGDTMVVCLNFTGEEQRVDLPFDGMTFRVGNYGDTPVVEAAAGEGGGETLRPWEGRLYMM